MRGKEWGSIEGVRVTWEPKSQEKWVWVGGGRICLGPKTRMPSESFVQSRDTV